MQLQFYRDTAGDPRARGRGRGKAVAGFLESDLQGSAASAREVLGALNDIEAGSVQSWERTGNAYTLTLSPGGAVLQDEMDEEAKPSRISLSEIRKAVADWLSFLNGE
ncbi:MAG TPA: YacL family protein [Thermoanaerobaculia bacterium]|jgi:uncharacterized protein YacL (UPF0231 family)|nr:YacL family protein [Thermoanaerobaculia bacterium]